ncbi:hypothetical protein [Nocardia sp. NBC_00508]|uniref:hypothetical protein n=1 Tax=Nocardia sp. NBC_00508 TaxID=2975992 RepID=UPI003FA5764D
MDADAARGPKELREQNARLKRLLAEAELEKAALRERSRRGNSEPRRQAPRRRHIQSRVEHVGTFGVQGGWGRSVHLSAYLAGAYRGRSGR